ncbi:hypothetical protein PAMP_002928 [Pampus punctatissimus]
MDATQMINDSILESDEEENEEENKDKRGQPLAKLCILNNEHIPAAELPLFLGDNVLGRDPNTCTLLLPAPSVSKQHATICISVYERRGCHSKVDMEALIWDLGSMNGTRKGRLKLTPNVRYALEEGNSLVVADIPCQYVSCAVETVSSQGDMRTPMSRNSDVMTRLSDASNEKGGDTRAGSKKCVNGGTKPSAMVSSLDVEDTRKTPARITCLSFEQTPAQPHGTLVPESDSDSDGEGRRKPLVLQCDSDSYKSSPTCSTFLSPTNKIVPESEDESPITPSSSTKNRPYRHVSLSKEEPDIDVGRQQLKKKEKLVLVDNSEEEEGREEERATPGGMTLEKSGQDVLVKQESDVNVTKEEELPVSTRAFSTDLIPVFNMDSDTDMEGEEENVASAAPVTLNTNQQADQPPNTVQFHMDSDTDVDEDEDTFDKGPKCVFFTDNNTKPPHALPVIQPEGITMDSDTDVDDDADMSDAAAKAKPTFFLSAHAADSAPSSQPKDFHLDSDTDVDEEEQNECGTNSTCSKIDEAPTRIDVKHTGPESAPAAPNSLHLDSDTDDEVISAPAVNKAPVVSAVTDSCTTADAGADNSDTDVEEDSPLVIPVAAVPTLSVTPGITLAAAPSDSDADTDVDESSVPPARDGDNPADLRPNSDGDVEDKDAELGEVEASKLPVPLLQNRSTPVQFSEGEVEDMETQAFLSPSLDPMRRAVAPAVRPVVLSSCSDSQEDEDFVVAETQSFILQTRNDHAMDPTQAFVLESSGDEGDRQSSRGGSFQLGLSDSSHLQCQAQALAMESTQAFVSVGGGVNLEDTRADAAISTADRTSVGNDLNLEATQAYGGDEEPARSPVTFEKEGQGDLALEATQAFITEPCSDSEDETEEDERKNLITADFTTSSAFTMAETQPVCVFREEESLATESHTSSKTDAIEEHVEAAQPEERPLRGALSVVETMCTSDDEDSMPCPRRRKAKQLEEETQPIPSSDYSSVDTQPMHVDVDKTQPVATSGNEESDDEDSSPFPQKRKAKQLQLEEEGTETLSAAETQPTNTCEDKESDDEDSIPGPRKKRKAKQLEEETQPISSSDYSSVDTQPMHVDVDETQPVATSGNEESDDEDSSPFPQKRKAKQLQLEEEGTETLSAAETQPTNTCEDKESDDDEDSIPGPRKKRKAKQLEEETQSISSSDYLSVEIQPMHVGVDETQPMATSGNEESDDEDSIPGPRKKSKAKPLQFEDEQTQPLTGSVVPSDEIEAVVTGEDMENDDEELIISQRKRKAKPLQLEEEETQSLTNSEASTVESQAVRTNTGPQPQREKGRPSEATTSGISVRSKRGTRARLREEEDQAESSEAPRRQTRGNKAFSNSRGRKQKSRFDESEEDEEVEQVKRARGKKSMRHQKDEEEKDRLEIERNKQEQQEEMLGEEKDVTELKQREREETEKETMKIDERERLDMEKREMEEIERQQRREEQERIEREIKDKEEQERLQAEKAERLRLEQEGAEKERIERERWEEEAKERADRIQEQKEKEKIEKERLECEKAEKEEKERLEKEENERIERERKEQEDDVVLVRKTRSRSNSVSSEKSATSVNIQGSRGRGRGRGARRTNEPAQATISRGNNRRTTVAAEPFGQSQTTEQDSNDISPQGILSRSNSSISLNSEISISSSCISSQNRGRGGRQRGRRRTTEPGDTPPISGQSDQNSTPKPTARGRKSRKTEVSSNEVSHEGDKEKADSQQASATRGQKQSNVNDPELKTADEEGCVSEHSLLAKRTVRGRGQKEVKSVEVHDDEDKATEKRKGEKELKANAEGAQTAEAAREEAKDATTQVKRRGRASSSKGSKNAKEPPPEVEVKDESEKKEEEIVERRARGRPSVVQKKKKEVQEESGTCVGSINQDANMTSEPQTPNSSASRKRQAPADSSPVAKTPRSASASPAAGGRLRAASQAYKVLFTGVVDEAGERVLARLGGSMAKGVADMNCLVTDKVRRTVKFLCAVAKGVPIVTTHWLEKSGKAGSFLSPNAFAVNDPEQEKKFNFCLQESLKVASSQPLLQGYEIHVTKSVKPEPVQMKDIISCSGATFLPKMPSFHKPQTVVISCEEDWSLCGPAVSASLPIVTAEFILTGILQQKFDTQTHKLSESTANLQPAGGRGRGRKKT